jgi:glutathione S-transferase
MIAASPSRLEPSQYKTRSNVERRCLQLYQLPVSLYSFKVRLALTLKGIHVPMIKPHEGTYRSAAYRVVVPTGTIPALVADGLVLTESDAIIEYLDDVHGGRRLVDGSPERKARIRMVSRLNDLQVEPQVRALFSHVAPSHRDARHVSETTARLSEKLALMEWALDATGPFAIDNDVTMPDCGIAATLTWFYALHPLLAPSLQPGPRLERVYRALARDAIAGPELTSYRALVDTWVSNKLKS